MRSEASRLLTALFGAFGLVACGSVFGLSDYKVTDKDNCAGELVDLTSDPRHCGDCDTVCAGDGAICVDGRCDCDDGSTNCSGACVDTSKDATHCGDCDTACTSDAKCSHGMCACKDSSLTLCTDGCVDTTSDPQNCGDCGHDCGSGATCVDGK